MIHSLNFDVTRLIDCFVKLRLPLLLCPHIFYFHWLYLVNSLQIVIFSFGYDVSRFRRLIARENIMSRLFLVACVQNGGMSLLHFGIFLTVHSLMKVWLDYYLGVAKAIHLILHGLLCSRVILGLSIALYNGNIIAKVLILGQLTTLDKHSHGIYGVILGESLGSSQIACLVFILLWYIILITQRCLGHVQKWLLSTNDFHSLLLGLLLRLLRKLSAIFILSILGCDVFLDIPFEGILI